VIFVKDILLWFYWNPFRLFIQRIPAPAVYLTARIISSLLYLVAHAKRKSLEREYNSTLKNGINLKQRNKLIKNAFFVLMCNEFEMLRFPILNTLNIDSHVSCRGLKYLDRALEKGKGAMLLFAHFGANQMVMPAMGYRGYRMSQMSAPATVWTEKINDRSFSGMEKKALQQRWEHELSLPVSHINIFGSLKQAFLCLKRNEILGVAIDGGSGKERTKVRFLGREALFSHGAVDIALRTGCTVLPTFMVRQKDGRNVMHIMEPLKIRDNWEKREVMSEAIQEFCRILEKFVMQYPCHYINFLALRSFMARRDDVPLFPVDQDLGNNES